MDPIDLNLEYSSNLFNLKIQNKSHEQVNIWGLEYSLGYDAIYFKISKEEGACIIKRKPIIWTVNPPVYYSIQPGNFKILKFKFHDNTWDLKECNKMDDNSEIQLKCVLEIARDEDTSKYNILTGVYYSNPLSFNSILKVIGDYS